MNVTVISPRYAYVASVLQTKSLRPIRVRNLPNAVACAFVWSKQPEGAPFWRHMYMDLCRQNERAFV